MLRRTVSAVCCFFILASYSFADQLDNEKGKAKQMLKIVVSEIQKNYYDPEIKGVDLAKLTAQASEMIESARSVGEVYMVVYGLVDRINDSHTVFDPPSRTVFPRFDFSAKAYGENVYVNWVKKKGVAEKAGLQAGDRVLQVNGFEVDRESINKMMIFFHRIQPVSELVLFTQRGNEAPKKVVVVARVERGNAVEAWYNLNDIFSSLEHPPNEDDGRFIDAEGNSGIGYLYLRSFVVDPENINRFASLAGKKPKAVIIDLRGNFGGIADTLVNFSGHFVTQEEEMAQMVRRKKTEPIKIKPQRGSYSVPMVILVDSQSASASEMFARHFQRAHQAVVIGDRTAGAVVTARYFGEELGAGSVTYFGVNISIGRVLFSDNEDLEGKGVSPDIKCLPSPDDLRLERDVCYGVALATLEKKLGVSTNRSTNPQSTDAGNN